MPEMNNTSAEPFELVATYKNIATIDSAVVMEVKGNDVTPIKIYMGDKVHFCEYIRIYMIIEEISVH